MSKTVHKFTLPRNDRDCTVLIPEGAIVLSAHNQYEQATIWALVDPGRKPTPRRFLQLHTGEPARGLATAHFVGSVIMNDGSYVVHVFEVMP
jgi:hypothetical protein